MNLTAFLDPDTEYMKPGKLAGLGTGFRTMAPQASQRAALQENPGSNAGPVMKGISLDV